MSGSLIKFLGYLDKCLPSNIPLPKENVVEISKSTYIIAQGDLMDEIIVYINTCFHDESDDVVNYIRKIHEKKIGDLRELKSKNILSHMSRNIVISCLKRVE